MRRLVALLGAWGQSLLLAKLRFAPQWLRSIRYYRFRTALPDYRFFNHLSANDELPIINKSIWLASFEQLNQLGLSLDGCRKAAELNGGSATVAGVSVGLSSGTTGSQGVFLTSPIEQATWAGLILGRTLNHLPARIALGLRTGGALYQAASFGPIKLRHFSLERFTDAAIRDFGPTVIVAPPESLRCLSEDSIRQAKQIYSVGDFIEPKLAHRLSALIGKPVGQIYQATEGFLGFSCTKGQIHLNEDFLIVEKEYVDKAKTRFIPIVTDLLRRTQVVVRLRLDDVLREVDCDCGLPLTAVVIEGRVADLWELPHRTIFQDELRQCVSNCDDYFVGYRDGRIDLAVSPERRFGEVAAKLRDLVGDPEIEICSSSFAEPEASGKTRRIRFQNY